MWAVWGLALGSFLNVSVPHDSVAVSFAQTVTSEPVIFTNGATASPTVYKVNAFCPSSLCRVYSPSQIKISYVIIRL